MEMAVRIVSKIVFCSKNHKIEWNESQSIEQFRPSE